MEQDLTRPWMTVVIATYNSSRFLPGIKKMLDSQEKPDEASCLEVLVVDGGSVDDTREIAESFGYRVIDNPRGHAIAAKFLGLNNASSRFVCVLDHDEALVDNDSLLRRYKMFREVSNLRAIVSAGYRFAGDESSSNMYASEFGDPVSLVVYGCPNNEKFRARIFRQRLDLVSSDGGGLVFLAGTEKKPILCEMAAGSGTIDVDHFRAHYPELFTTENLFPHAYYMLNDHDKIGMIVGDAIIHDSAESWRVVRAKIRWRLNNLIFDTEVASSGFSGRHHSRLYSPARQQLLFALYALSVVIPLLHTVWLMVSRRRFGYLHHFLLTYYVVIVTGFLLVQRMFNKSTKDRRYGE